jgi:hypothetical protein
MNRFIHNLLKDLAELIHGAIDIIGPLTFLLLVIAIGLCLAAQDDKSAARYAAKQAAIGCQWKERK